MSYLDLRDLAKEFQDLKDQESGPENYPPLDEEEADRLKALAELDGELGGMEAYANNEPTLIPDDEFRDYARELAKDVGYLSDGDNNPLMAYIDWDAWADALKTDYTEVTFDGDTYLIRAY